MYNEDTQEMRVWICGDCCSDLNRYEHSFEWSESFNVSEIIANSLNFDEDDTLDVDDADNNEGYDGYGLCIGCQEVSAELGTGWFIEKCIVETEFDSDRVYYRTTVQT